MSYALTSPVSYTLGFQPASSDGAGQIAAIEASGQFTKRINFATGTTTAGKANRIYAANHTIAANNSLTLDLTSLTDVLGQNLTFSRVKGISVQLVSYADNADYGTNATLITVGGAASNPALENGMFAANGSMIELTNGGYVTIVDPSANGTPVTGSYKNLKITNQDLSLAAYVSIGILGADA